MTPLPVAPLRVLVVDDSEVVRMGLRALLGADPSLTIVAEAHNVASAIEAATRHQPDIVLLDIRLPDGTGFDACRQILQRSPATRVLVLTSVADEDVVDNAIRAGSHGYLLKEVHGRALLQAIHDVAAGKSILDPAITARVLALMRSTAPATKNTLSMLSPQEHRVLALISEGRTNKEVAHEMSLTEKTVKNYLSNIFDKLHVSRRAEAAVVYTKGISGH